MLQLKRDAGLVATAAVLPLMASAASIFVHIDPSAWFSMTASQWRAAAADALLYIAGAAVIAAPLAGVAVGSRKRGAWLASAELSPLAAVWPLSIAVVGFVATSALLTLFGFGIVGEDGWRFVATSHATLAAVSFALCAFGALCGGTFRDPLDAVACSLLIVFFATAGLLVAGAAVADAPRQLIDVALTASPLVAIASAAHIDIVRMGVPYQISPLAHLQIDYPTWYAASAWYLAVAGLCFVGLTWRSRAWPVRSE
jgi:hypothetical protein